MSESLLPLELEFRHACVTPSDINEHCPFLASLAAIHNRVTELGTRYGVSTRAFLAGRPKKLTCYDLVQQIDIAAFQRMAPETEFIFHVGDSRRVDIENTDLLFIDTYHTGEQLAEELTRHHAKVARTIVMHDTETFGINGEDGKQGTGLLLAMDNFLIQHPEWAKAKHFHNNNGLTVLIHKHL